MPLNQQSTDHRIQAESNQNPDLRGYPSILKMNQPLTHHNAAVTCKKKVGRLVGNM